MGHRNMLCTDEMMVIGMDQHAHGYLYHGPPMRIAGPVTNFQPASIRTMVAASGSNPNYEGQYLPERHDGTMFYGAIQYNGVHLHHHHNFYPSFVPPSSAGVLPVVSEQLSSSTGYGVLGSSADEFGGSNHYFADGIRGPCKSKAPESAQGHFHHFNASGTPISSVPPMNARHLDGVSIPEPVSFSMPQYSTGNGNPPIMHDHNHLPRGNFAGQHFQPSGMWLERHMGSSSSGDGALLWNQGPSMPFIHAPMETANIGMPRHQETIRGSQHMRHASTVNLRHQAHHASSPVLRPREHNVLTSTSHRSSSNSARINRTLPHNGLEMGHRHIGAVPPTGIRISRPHRGVGSDAAPRHHQHLAQLRYLQADEVAILEIPDYYEISGYADHHSDMRLDIEDMSYEELLALGERIGNVNTGLSEETIASQLKTVPYLSPRISMNNLEEADCSDKEAHCCIICQDNYKTFEKVGILNCGHDYHAECLTKWLVIKNVCPICKSEALSTNMDL